MPELQLVALEAGQVLYQAQDPVRYVYFPHSGVVSQLLTMETGEVLEVGLVGYEGLVGLCCAFGAERAAHTAVVQIAGSAHRMAAELLWEEMRAGGAVQERSSDYADAVYMQMSQLLACTNFHQVEQRCARWLLTVADRAGQTTFPLSQQHLAEMLGVRRASVTTALAPLQQAGLVRSGQGQIAILDRRGLEAVACECDGLIRERFARLYRSHVP